MSSFHLMELNQQISGSFFAICESDDYAHIILQLWNCVALNFNNFDYLPLYIANQLQISWHMKIYITDLTHKVLPLD